MRNTSSFQSMLRFGLIVVVLAAFTFLTKPTFGQFSSGAYGNLVWDPDKQCWIRIDRRGQTRRLLDGDVLYLPDEKGGPGLMVAEGMPYIPHGEVPGGVMIINGGTQHVDSATPTPEQIARFNAALDSGEVPKVGPAGQPLAPGARAFLGELTTSGGYSDLGDRTGYGDVPDNYDPLREFLEEDKTGIASSVHIKDYGTFYMSNGGNVLHVTGSNFDWQARTDYTDTTDWTGLGSTTNYPLSPNEGDPGSLKNVTYHVDPTNDRCTHVTFTFNGRDTYTLNPNSGVGMYIDPFPIGSGSGGPLQVLQYNPNNKKQPWVQPGRKDPPKKKKDPKKVDPKNLEDIQGLELGADWDPLEGVGLGHDWQRRADREPNFDGEPQIGVVPSINVAFLGPPPGSQVDLEGSGEDLQGKADAATEYIAKFTETMGLIGAQEKIAQLQTDAVNMGADELSKKVEGILMGQAEALVGAIFSNANKLQDVYDKMPAGARKNALGGFLNSGFYHEVLSEGGQGGGSAGLLVYQTFKDGELTGDDALNWFFSDFVAGKYLPPQLGALVGQARAFGDTMVAYGQFANVANDAGELMDSLVNINRAINNLNNWVGDNGHVVDDYYGAVSDFTENLINETSGMDGLDRVHLINDAIEMLHSTSNGLDIGEEIARLESERDNTVIYLPGGEWGTEPVLYERLWLVPNAGKRYGMLIDSRMAQKFGPDWKDNLGNRPPPGMVTLPLYPPPKDDEPKVQPGSGGSTPAPPAQDGDDASGNTPIQLPDGSTASVPPGGAGPIRMADGTRIYNYDSGRVERFFVMPGGATVTHFRSGGYEVVGPDGTITEKSSGGVTKVTLPSGITVVQGPNGQTVTDTADGLVLDAGQGQDALVQPGFPIAEGNMPIVGDFDAEGTDDLGVFTGEEFFFETMNGYWEIGYGYTVDSVDSVLPNTDANSFSSVGDTSAF